MHERPLRWHSAGDKSLLGRASVCHYVLRAVTASEAVAGCVVLRRLMRIALGYLDMRFLEPGFLEETE
jgi:hypothetical protein